ncbi:MAG: DUF2231 domain-containing protein [Hyphomonadaceae bacterium]|jgi:uncharacterized membrane protein|nr:DUF2231 domain-containing protein [Hyphomonadaceae bacterium]
MTLHPLHPMLVHLPVACWTLTPLCDALAIGLGQDVFWRAGAIIAAFGAVGGALAATAGAMDLPRAQAKAAKLALVHASLMGTAWTLAVIGLLGRVDQTYVALSPAPWWAITASGAALLVMIAGAWCGGELVYGRGVGVRERS